MWNDKHHGGATNQHRNQSAHIPQHLSTCTRSPLAALAHPPAVAHCMHPCCCAGGCAVGPSPRHPTAIVLQGSCAVPPLLLPSHCLPASAARELRLLDAVSCARWRLHAKQQQQQQWQRQGLSRLCPHAGNRADRGTSTAPRMRSLPCARAMPRAALTQVADPQRAQHSGPVQQRQGVPGDNVVLAQHARVLKATQVGRRQRGRRLGAEAPRLAARQRRQQQQDGVADGVAGVALRIKGGAQ